MRTNADESMGKKRSCSVKFLRTELMKTRIMEHISQQLQLLETMSFKAQHNNHHKNSANGVIKKPIIRRGSQNIVLHTTNTNCNVYPRQTKNKQDIMIQLTIMIIQLFSNNRKQLMRILLLAVEEWLL